MSWIARQRALAGWVGTLVFAALILAIIYGKYPYLTWNTSLMLSLYACWTIGVPLWLFLETIEGRKMRSGETPDQYKARVEHLSATQNAARQVWAGCAAAIGIFLLAK